MQGRDNAAENPDGRYQQSLSQPPSWKVVLIGEEGVGKTSLFERIHRNSFSENRRTTVGLDQGSALVEHTYGGSKTVRKLHIWDTAGSERHSSITLSYYRGSKAVLLVFSLDSELSLARLQNWVADAKMFAPTACLILLGNKIDLANGQDLQEIPDVRAAKEMWRREYPRDIRGFYCVSAKTREGLDEALQGLCTLIAQQLDEEARQMGYSVPPRGTGTVDVTGQSATVVRPWYSRC